MGIGLGATAVGFGACVLANHQCAPNSDRCDQGTESLATDIGAFSLAFGLGALAGGSAALYVSETMAHRLRRVDLGLAPWSAHGAGGLAVSGRF